MRHCTLIAPLILALTASVFSPRAHFAADRPWTRHEIDASSRGADGVRTADVNGDGIPDLVAGWEQGGLTPIYVGSRTGHDDMTGRRHDVNWKHLHQL